MESDGLSGHVLGVIDEYPSDCEVAETTEGDVGSECGAEKVLEGVDGCLICKPYGAYMTARLKAWEGSMAGSGTWVGSSGAEAEAVTDGGQKKSRLASRRSKGLVTNSLAAVWSPLLASAAAVLPPMLLS